MGPQKTDPSKSQYLKPGKGPEKNAEQYLKAKPAETEYVNDSDHDDDEEEDSGGFSEDRSGGPTTMAPAPYDDLFIEPAGDYDVVYGDYNSTMDGSNSGKRPYIRLTSSLPNVTRSLGGEVRLKCEAAGSPLPLTFAWLKNNAPVERNRRTKIRSKEYFSKLIINELEVLDSGYYQCTASNVAGSVNTTAVLRVNTQLHKPSTTQNKPKKPPKHALDDYSEDTYDDYEDMNDRGRLPADEEADLFRVPNSAAGPGYVPLSPVGGQDRWLDGMTMRTGDCVLYQGDACRNYLSGRHVMVTTESREAMYDIDRELRAAVMFIQNIRDLSPECKNYSHAVACYHMYKICDQSNSPSTSSKTISLCRKDCESLKDEVCPKGFSLAAQHELVGDGPKALLPHCTSLSPSASRCLSVLEPLQPPPPIQKQEKLPHWCYVDSGVKYEGPISEAVSGKVCLPWSQVEDETYNVRKFPKLQKVKNHCRNPDGKVEGPWCFTKPHGERELCDVPKCPKNMYPELADGYGQNGVMDSINNTWNGLSSQWQLTAVAGLGGFAFLLLVLLICCCCRRRKSNTSTSSSMKKINGYPNNIQSCNGSSIVTSGINSGGYGGNGRKYQPVQGGQYEMNSLLPQNPHQNYQIQGGYVISQQYSPPTTEPPVEPFHVNEILPQHIKIDKVAGEGPFTIAYSGDYISDRGLTTPIMVKTLKQGFSRIEQETFEDEIKSIASFNHMNVIRMLGVSYFDGQELSAVFDYNCHGDLHAFLKVREPLGMDNDDKEKLRNFEDFFKIGVQIAGGMEYLSRMGHVHRDLATRNCLVGDQQIVKISDFASMQQVYDKDYYVLPSRTRVPLRWLSKESLQDSRYSSASDVYAFGVVLWEIYTYGRQPYEGFTNQEVIRMVSMHDLLPCPVGCPPNIYSVMIECWNETPERRPGFGELHSKFQKWCLIGPNQFFMSSNRATSSHSGGSSNKRLQSSNPSLTRNMPNFINDPYQVPPPAPVHSTPIGR